MTLIGAASKGSAANLEGSMYQVIRSQGLGWTVTREAVPAAAALVLAEVFYKFHSFTLELLAFAATWCILSWAYGRLVGNKR